VELPRCDVVHGHLRHRPKPGEGPRAQVMGPRPYLHAATSFNEIADRAEKLERSLNGQ
jgi:hypothetical protein